MTVILRGLLHGEVVILDDVEVAPRHALAQSLVGEGWHGSARLIIHTDGRQLLGDRNMFYPAAGYHEIPGGRWGA